MKAIYICLFVTVRVYMLDLGDIKLATAAESENSRLVMEQYESVMVDESPTRKSNLPDYDDLDIRNKVSNEESRFSSIATFHGSDYSEPIKLSTKVPNEGSPVVFKTSEKADQYQYQNKIVIESYHNNHNESNQTHDFDSSEKLKTEVQYSAAEMQTKSENKSDAEEFSNQYDSKKLTPEHEDIPSFSEWTQKQLAEAEKKKTGQNDTAGAMKKGRGKFRNKNYASPDCGAKIVAANPESVSSSSVLSSLKDEYMLNYCTNRIWFIVELCEAIQAKQLDLANFELFSSSPKHFSVFVSHRFPTREWNNVGKFTAQDSRDVQTFNLHPHFFGKYIKVEMHSHYGREQFCPISWVGIYGTSEYEVLAKEDERNSPNEDDYGDAYDEEIFVGHKRNSPKNLFSSATEAVLSIVKKATAPFMKSEYNETESVSCPNSTNSKNSKCVSPRHIIVCNNCSHNFYDGVFKVLSCEYQTLENFISSSFVRNALVQGDSCFKLGLDFVGDVKQSEFFSPDVRERTNQGVRYLGAMLKSTFMAALCNALAVSENKTTVNVTADNFQSLKNLTQKDERCNEKGSVADSSSKTRASSSFLSSSCQTDCVDPPASEFHLSTAAPGEISETHSFLEGKIRPTKTLNGNNDDPVATAFTVLDAGAATKSDDPKSSGESPLVNVIPTLALEQNEPKKGLVDSFLYEKGGRDSGIEADSRIQKEAAAHSKDSSTSLNQDSATLESIISDLNGIENAMNSPSNSLFASANLPTESIFLRLANRIKNLELNMSLSSAYLEELSRRYKMQLDLLSKSLNLTMQKIEEISRAEQEKERKREKEMLLIRMKLANLTQDVSAFVTEQNSWSPRASCAGPHVLFITVEILIVCMFLGYWKRSDEVATEKPDARSTRRPEKKSRRRNSLEGVKGHETIRKKSRRPSEEALDIALSRCQEKKRKKKKKDSKCSLNGFHSRKKLPDAEDFEDCFTREVYSSLARDSEGFNDKIVVRSSSAAKENVSASKPSSEWGPRPIATICADSAPKVPPGESSTHSNHAKTALTTRNFQTQKEKESSSHEFDVDQELMKKEIQKVRKSSNTIKKYMRKFF